MAVEVFNRRECKYLINEVQFHNIEKQLEDYTVPDQYINKNEFYTITNIYYDTDDNQMIRNSLNKPKYKEKLRLRAYGVPEPDQKVFLEIKKKVCGLVNKRRTTLKLQEAYDFVDTGIKPEMKDYMNKQVLNEIEYILKIYDPKPKLYLAYDRKAMYGKENRALRITFDTNITTRRYDLRLENGDYGDLLLEKGQWLMEIKAENSIPVWLTKILSDNRVFSTSFSKYGTEYQEMLMKNRNMKGEASECSKHFLTHPQLIPQYL